jgi:hypothetical protein
VAGGRDSGVEQLNEPVLERVGAPDRSAWHASDGAVCSVTTTIAVPAVFSRIIGIAFRPDPDAIVGSSTTRPADLPWPRAPRPGPSRPRRRARIDEPPEALPDGEDHGDGRTWWGAVEHVAGGDRSPPVFSRGPTADLPATFPKGPHGADEGAAAIDSRLDGVLDATPANTTRRPCLAGGGLARLAPR